MNDFQTCLNLFRFNMIWIVKIHMILKHVWTCSNISRLVQVQYDMNCCDSYYSQTCLNMLKLWTCWNMSELVQTNMSKLVQNQYNMNCYNSLTCLNLFRINMIRIVTILKHVWTCSESIWYELLWFSNMSKLVQNQYDTNWYNSQTCQDSRWKHDEIH